MAYAVQCMRFVKRFFPENSRHFSGMRWVSIGLRTLHLVGVVGMGGAFLQHIPPSVWLPYLWVTIISGVAMLLLEIWCSGVFIFQLRGIAILVKLLLLASLYYLNIGAYVMVAVVVISGIISHAPGKIRYFILFKRVPFKTESIT